MSRCVRRSAMDGVREWLDTASDAVGGESGSLSGLQATRWSGEGISTKSADAGEVSRSKD